MRVATVSDPSTCHVDQQGTIYVADAADDAVKKLSKKLSMSGQVLAAWGGAGSVTGQLSWPLP